MIVPSWTCVRFVIMQCHSTLASATAWRQPPDPTPEELQVRPNEMLLDTSSFSSLWPCDRSISSADGRHFLHQTPSIYAPHPWVTVAASQSRLFTPPSSNSSVATPYPWPWRLPNAQLGRRFFYVLVVLKLGVRYITRDEGKQAGLREEADA